MLGVNENSACAFHIRWKEEVNFKVSLNDSISKDRLKLPISIFLKVGFENSLTAIYRTT